MQNADIVAINEQKVVELEIRVKQLERANAELQVAKLRIEMLSIDNAEAYLSERKPHLMNEMAEARARLAEMPKNDH